MAQPKGIIWDVGGTMVVRTLLEYDYIKVACRDAGVSPAPMDLHELKMLSIESKLAQDSWRSLEEERAGFRELARRLLGGEAAREADVERLGERLCRYYDVYRMVPGIPDLLDDLATRGVPMAVVSEWPPSLREFLVHHDLLRYFRVVVGTAEEGVLKPHPQLIQKALNGLGLPAEAVLYIGDNPQKDMEPARAMGLPTIHFNPKHTYQADCHETADLRARLERMFPECASD